MKTPLKIFPIILCLIIVVSGCATPIKKIYKKADKLNGKRITVKGVVISSLELIDLYSFTIKDRSGKIMIVTDNLLPLKNDKLRVHGILDKNFIYKQQPIIVIKEKKMEERKIEDSKRKMEKI